MTFFGDSHIRQFFFDFIGDVSLNWFSGATAQGLVNKNSKSRAGEILAKHVELFKPKLVFLMFGAVDLDFTLFKKLSENINFDIDGYIDFCVNRYVEFILNIHCNCEVLHILGNHLPTTQDSHIDKSIFWSAGLDFEIVQKIIKTRSISHKDRISFAKSFNDKLGSALLGHGSIKFDRIDEFMLNEFGEVDSKFVIHPWEHHANKTETFKLWSQKLNFNIHK